MFGKYVRAVFAGGVAAAALFALAGGGASTAQDKKVSISEIMQAGHGKTDPLLGKVIGAVKDGKWADATAAAKSLDTNAGLLGKAMPKRGDAASWMKLTDTYHKHTSALLAATEKKEAGAAKEAVGAITGMCKECHSAHKGAGKK
jgi:cytochrome c556